MRKLLLATAALTALSTAPALAADLPSIEAAPAVAGVNWGGFYIGANFGAARGFATWSNPAGAPLILASPRFAAQGDQNGVFGGVTTGLNYQIGAWVLGLEGDVSFPTLYGNAVCGGEWGGFLWNGGGFGWNCKAATNVLASLTGRAGYSVGAALLFGKFGLAYAHGEYAIVGLEPSVGYVMGGGEANRNHWGWTLGAGLEYALGGPWSAKAEYDYMSFPSQAWSAAGIGARVGQTRHLVKFGLNYRLGGGLGSGASAPAPAIASDVSGEFGARVGYTTGHFDFDLKAPADPTTLNSRLDWINQRGVALEGFARLDHTSGAFVKGMIGGNGLFGDHMHDEDYPPGTIPYSNTYGRTRRGNGMYATADLGWAYRAPGWRLGAFVGYSHNEEQLHAYGCEQISVSDICGPPGALPGNMIVLSRHESWNALRIGLAGDVDVTERIRISADAAYLPTVSFRGHDNHWARPDINPLSDAGGGYGYQLEGIVSYRFAERLRIGAGARYWYAKADGQTQFPFADPSPTIYRNGRTTLFLQTAYGF
jgi:opacity protein-like surface antigen